jgi:hypothetical protein
VLDAAGLALFAVAGVEKALLFRIRPFIAMLMGTVTGTSGTRAISTSRITPPPTPVTVPISIAINGRMRNSSAFSTPATANSARPAASSTVISAAGNCWTVEWKTKVSNPVANVNAG